MKGKPPFIVIHRPITTPPRPERSPVERPAFTPKEKPNPLVLAQFWLRGRLEERTLGFFLDGQPASLDRLMRETYRVMIAQGEQPDIPNDRWRP